MNLCSESNAQDFVIMTRSFLSILHNVIIFIFIIISIPVIFISPILHHIMLVKSILMYEKILQVIWYPGPCTTSNPCTSRTPATGLRSTRRPPTSQCTGSPRPSTHCVTSCTVHRWSGRTPTLSHPKSLYRLRGKSCRNLGDDAAFTLLVQSKSSNSLPSLYP